MFHLVILLNLIIILIIGLVLYYSYAAPHRYCLIVCSSLYFACFMRNVMCVYICYLLSFLLSLSLDVYCIISYDVPYCLLSHLFF